VGVIRSEKSWVLKPFYKVRSRRGCASKYKLHFISMFDCEARLMLFHKTVGSKTNEIPAVRDSNYVRRIILSHWHRLYEKL